MRILVVEDEKHLNRIISETLADEGYQTDEIAAMLDRPPSTVRNQLRDARAKLKLTLGGEGT